jgi:hypothetical protein
MGGAAGQGIANRVHQGGHDNIPVPNHRGDIPIGTLR